MIDLDLDLEISGEFKGNSSNLIHKGQFTQHGEHFSVSENNCIISPGAREEFCQV